MCINSLMQQRKESEKLSAVSSKSVKMDEIPVLCGVVMEVLGWERAAWRNSLGISPSILTRFTQMRGSVSKTDAMKVANRLKTFLKERRSRLHAHPARPHYPAHSPTGCHTRALHPGRAVGQRAKHA